MINHARTLLLNATRGIYDADFPGEEYVPADFLPRVVPEPSATIRRLLFGTDPDRYMLNFRLRQLMPVWHATELASHVLAFDPRITYWPTTKLDLYALKFTTEVTERVPGSGSLTVIGELDPHEDVGHLFHWWAVTKTSDTTATVKRLVAPLQSANCGIVVTDDMSSPIPLVGSSLSCIVTGPVGSSWYVKATARPQRNMGDLLATLKAALTGADDRVLFGTNMSEPVKTWYNCWRSHPDYAYQLGGLLLGVVNQLNGIRGG